MKLLIKNILEKWACKHKWVLHHTVNVFRYDDDKMPLMSKQILICTECGKIKKIRL